MKKPKRKKCSPARCTTRWFWNSAPTANATTPCSTPNVTEYSDQTSRHGLIKQLMSHAAPDPWLLPPLFCNCSYNIFVGYRTFWNLSCVLLDVMAVRISVRCMIGSAIQIHTAIRV